MAIDEIQILPNVLLPYLLLLIGILAALVGGFAIATWHGSPLQTRLQSIALRTELANVRLGRLLSCRHIRIGDYFQAFPLVEIRRQVAACRKCRSKSACDRAFASCQMAYPFCPHRAAIERFVSHKANLMDGDGI